MVISPIVAAAVIPQSRAAQKVVVRFVRFLGLLYRAGVVGLVGVPGGA